MSPLCDHCRENLAVVFVTQITDDETHKFRLCEACARERALDSELFSEIVAQMEDDSQLMAIVDSTSGDEFPDTFDDATFENANFENAAFDDVFGEEDIPLDAPLPTESFWSEDPFDGGIFEAPGNAIDPFDDDSFASIPGVLAARCPTCGTTWERIKEDGRCGCADCYATFREHLVGVMARVHRGLLHEGKTPTTAQKRRLHSQNLRKRRENQLALLHSRLKDAIDAENYEEAALIRDKIKEASGGE